MDSIGRLGGHCIYWKATNFRFTLLSFSSHHICGDVVGENGVA